MNFGTKYFETLSKNPNVHVFLNSNLIDVGCKNNRLQAVKVSSYNGTLASIGANNFVFAMGGIENSRYLLWFKSQYGTEFISKTTPIGRYWMEHPHFTLGQAIIDKSIVTNRFYSLSSAAQIDNNILNCGFRIEELPKVGTKALIRDVLCVAPNLGRKIISLAGKDLVCGARFRAAWEQAPIYKNCVKIDDEKDRFGVPKAILNWQKTELDRKTVVNSTKEFNDWLFRMDAGRIQLKEWILNGNEYPENDELAGYHHMGGTRMHANEEFGVVDSNCKVYGSRNLFIAGSSIFTTGGHNNPTLPIVQFSLRLAEHLVT